LLPQAIQPTSPQDSTPRPPTSLTPYVHLEAGIPDYLDPKLRDIEQDIGRLRAVPNADPKTRRDTDGLVELQREIRVLRDRLLRIAGLPYKPDQNDGVLISASPLWELFRYRPWQTVLKRCWGELNDEKYEWARLAYAIWPDRVRKVCSKDRSIAIAHGLEDLYEG